MEDTERDLRLARCIEDYHRRRALGENPSAEEYRELAGEDYEELEGLLEAEAMLDTPAAPPEREVLPRPFGGYTLVSELGRGAVGVVYEAVHRELGRKVALKILKTGFDTEASVVERFRREARSCSQMRHDHVVEVYEAGVCEDRHFYAMALIEGRTLRSLSRDGDLPEVRAFAAAIADVADALHHLHGHGIVHRDVKPSNIMVEASGRMILADFGLARTVASETLTRTGQSLGTPLYMSPEQVLGQKREINGRTDVYSLGATMYELLSGRPVFAASNLTALMRLILTERPQPLCEVVPRIPESLGRIVMKALEKRNGDRYESAAALRDDLLAFARGERVEGRPVPSWRRVGRMVRRRAIWVVPSALAALLVVVWFVTRPPAPATMALRSVPVARVVVDGRNRGSTPVEFELAPGEHRLELVREGWTYRARSVQLESGQRQDLELLMQPDDPTDPEALRTLAAALATSMPRWNDLEPLRSGDRKPFEAIFPRGSVRMEDLDGYRILLSRRFAQVGSLVFRADGNEVWRHRVDGDWPDELDHAGSLPAPVLAALQPGVTVTWGFEPDEGAPVTASFTLVDRDPGPRLALVESRLADHDPRIRAQIAARVLLDEGLPMAAWRRARALVTDGARLPGAWAVMRDALVAMDLEGADPWRELTHLSAPR